MIPQIYRGEDGYLQLLQDILDNGVDTPDRTSVGECRKLFNQVLWFDLRESQPMMTHRPIPTRWAFEELWFFISGNTDTKILEAKGITLWKGNTSREFLDGRGMRDYEEGDMGLAYGYQWRSFGGYVVVDQLQETIKLLKEDPYSRRNLTTFWNPADSDEMALLPCFHSHKFNVERAEGRNVLHMTVFSRSADAPFGLPFNLTQYGIYLKAMAKLVDMEAGNMVIHMDDVHIYKNQIEWVGELLTRDYYPILDLSNSRVMEPNCSIENICEDTYLSNRVSLNINKDLNTTEDLVSLKWEDIEVIGHKVNKEPFKTDKPRMSI